MSFKYAFLPLVSLTLIIGSCDSPEELGSCSIVTDLETYELVWFDEFEGTELDESKWSYQLGDGCPNLCGWGNKELQYYTDRPENVKVEDGLLTITAKREQPFFMGQHRYTSGRIRTKGKGDWRYGRIDVRAKVLAGQGLWPAIWMLPTDNAYGGWPTSGEIDIMEMVGSDPTHLFGTIHYGHDRHRFNGNDYYIQEGTLADDFHVYSVIWTEDCIQFMFDGELYGEPESRSTTYPSTWPFDQDFHMLLNVAIGGNLPGNPDGTTQFPQTLEVDYVRVYQ